MISKHSFGNFHEFEIVHADAEFMLDGIIKFTLTIKIEAFVQ